jgi:hypothetical protein
MKALTLTQPWATLVAVGAKRIETRSWRTSYRGPLAIHAAKGFPKWAREFTTDPDCYECFRGPQASPAYPLGAVLATCNLVACTLISLPFEEQLSDRERALGDYSPGRFAWVLEDAKPLLKPVPAMGHLGLWEWLTGTDNKVSPDSKKGAGSAE